MFCAYRLNIKTRFYGNTLMEMPSYLLKKNYTLQLQIYHVTAHSVQEPNLEQCSKMLNKIQKPLVVVPWLEVQRCCSCAHYVTSVYPDQDPVLNNRLGPNLIE
jgi:hypothetical protein